MYGKDLLRKIVKNLETLTMNVPISPKKENILDI